MKTPGFQGRVEGRLLLKDRRLLPLSDLLLQLLQIRLLQGRDHFPKPFEQQNRLETMENRSAGRRLEAEKAFSTAPPTSEDTSQAPPCAPAPCPCAPRCSCAAPPSPVAALRPGPSAAAPCAAPPCARAPPAAAAPRCGPPGPGASRLSPPGARRSLKEPRHADL